MYIAMAIGAARAVTAYGLQAAGNKETMDTDGEEDAGIDNGWFPIYTQMNATTGYR